MSKIKGELVENRIVIWDIEESRSLFREGFYGKPLGVPKPKGTDFNSPLILDLIEGHYLLKNNKLTIYRGKERHIVSAKKMDAICKSEYADFDNKYLVFTKLRKCGYVVTPGIKFGCDFAVYEQGPGIDHAPYLVQVVRADDTLTATSIILAGRLATTVRKQFILAIPYLKEKKVEFVSFVWWRA
ncbi:MAG: tRNA-intron lyase [Nitrososphaerales archaeon]